MEEEILVCTKRVGNAIVNVYRPILTPEERERREKIVRAELARFGRIAYERGVDLEAWSAKKQEERARRNEECGHSA